MPETERSEGEMAMRRDATLHRDSSGETKHGGHGEHEGYAQTPSRPIPRLRTKRPRTPDHNHLRYRRPERPANHSADLEVLGHSADIMYRWRRGEAPESGFDSFNSTKYCTVTKSQVILRLPYDMFGVKPGDTIRLCFNEQNQDTFGAAGFSDDRQLSLK